MPGQGLYDERATMTAPNDGLTTTSDRVLDKLDRLCSRLTDMTESFTGPVPRPPMNGAAELKASRTRQVGILNAMGEIEATVERADNLLSEIQRRL